MTVEFLSLTGQSDAAAAETVNTLLADLHDHPDLRRLLVLDDTVRLAGRTLVYERLVTARRVEDLLCVALGPRADGGRQLRLPGNLAGTQGCGVLWVSDPHGIDWRMAASAIATGHAGGAKSGLDYLVELLSVDEVFDRVRTVMTTRVPTRVASPGLHLAGADDEAAAFAGALAAAIRRLTEPAQGAEKPFRELLPEAIGGAGLASDGDLARCQADVLASAGAAVDALARLRGLRRLIRRNRTNVLDHVVEAGAALSDLRNQVDELLREVSTTGELTDSQRARVRDAGVQLPVPDPAAPDGAASADAAPSSPVARAIGEGFRGGDSLARVTKRLALVERELKHLGSASYLPEAEQRCPASLLARLADPPRRHARGASGRNELGINEAIAAASGLIDLVLAAANREWSGATPTSGEVARLRIALDGAGKALTAHAEATADVGGVAPGARLARLGESLMPLLRDLVLKVVVAESTAPSASGHEAFEHARQRAINLLAEWTSTVHRSGVLARPSFGSAGVHEVPYAGGDDVAEIREAVRYDPGGVMWQLCGSEDLGALDASGRPEVAWLAPRLNRDMLVSALPPETIWTSTGSSAGLLRLVPLRPGIVSSHWGSDTSQTGSAHLSEPSR